MGLLIHDEVTTPFNLGISNLVASCHAHVSTNKNGDKYYLSTVLRYYTSVNSTVPVFKRDFRVEISVNDFDSNLCAKIYAALASEYNSTEMV